MPIQLRPEARPAEWGHLDQHQKSAFVTLVRMIAEAADQLPLHSRSEPAEPEPAAWLSGKRSSRTVFLSGGRGTGKTTLLESIINETTSDKGSITQPGSLKSKEPEDPTPKSKEQEPKLVDDDFLKALQVVRNRVIWLEPIDMETMPSTANLLSAILARIEDSVRRFGASASVVEFRESDHRRESDYRPHGLLTAEYQDALLQLQRLQTDSALAWESNLDARKGELDPDSYAVEVQRCERARLAINQKLNQVLNALADKSLRGSPIRSPLFLLPVDDVDLNPLACLHLLRLLRMISVPRLFSLLLGDVQVADVVLNLKLSNDLASLFIDVRQPDFLALQPVFVSTMAGDIAANALRKLLPPSQRIRLLPMTLLEGLNFRPLGHDITDPRLHELLKKCSLDLEVPLTFLAQSPAGPVTLRDFLLVQGFPDPNVSAPNDKARALIEDGEIKGKYDFAYSGHHFFKAPPRRLADYWLMLQRLTTPAVGASNPYSDLVDHFARLCKTSLLSDLNLLPNERAQVENGIALTSKDEWELRRLPLRVSNDLEPAPHIESPWEVIKSYKPCFVPSAVRGWRFDVVLEGNRRPGGTRPPGLGGPPPFDDEENRGRRTLTGSVVPELTIFHDLLALGRERGAAYFSSSLLPPRPVVGPGSPGWMVTEWRNDAGEAVTLPWPAPPVRSFWEMDVFLNGWTTAVDQKQRSEDPEEQLQRLLAVWINFGTAVVDHQPPIVLGSPPTWPAITQRLNLVVNQASDEKEWRSHVAKQWLENLALLLMPESGLHKEVINPLLNSQGLKGFWTKRRDAIVRLRAMRLAELFRNDMPGAEKFRRAPVSFGKFEPSLALVSGFAGFELKSETSVANPGTKMTRPGGPTGRRGSAAP